MWNKLLAISISFFAVNCTKCRVLHSLQLLIHLFGSTVSVLFHCCNISMSTEHRGDNIKSGQRVCPRVN